MIDLGRAVWAIIQFFAATVMWLSVALFACKTIWNLVVPYAMIHEGAVHPERQHGWSLFILLDLGCLLIAVFASAVAGQYKVASSWTIALCCLGAIVLSYLHLFAVLFIAGFVRWLFNGKKGENDQR